MEKLAPSDYPVHNLIRRRWSPRAFSDRPVSEFDLSTMLEAARWAPSCNNEQPWRYYYALQGSDGFEKLLGCLSEGNKPWCKDAAGLLVSATRKTFEKNGKANDWAGHDAGMANLNLFLQGTELGIFCHPMAGFDKEAVIRALSLDDDIAPVCMIAFGYAGKAEDLPAPYDERELLPRVRKPVSEFAQRL